MAHDPHAGAPLAPAKPVFPMPEWPAKSLAKGVYAAIVVSLIVAAQALFCSKEQNLRLLYNLRVPGLDAEPAIGIVLRDKSIHHLIHSESELADWRARLSNEACQDLQGATLLPGLRDAHLHLGSLGTSLEQNLGLGDADSYDDMLARLESGLVGFKGDWFVARGWDESTWSEPGVELDRERLDYMAPDFGLIVLRVDGHAAFVNTVALARAGIYSETPDPEGGKILRDALGEPTGVLLDNAVDLVKSLVPADDEATRERRIRRALKHCAEMGLVHVTDAGLDSMTWKVLQRLAERGELPLRVYGMIGSEDLLEERIEQGPVSGLYGDRLSLRAVKLYSDGALGSRGARLLEPYADAPGNYGLWVTEPGLLARQARRAQEAGFQVCIHAIGDAATRISLNTLLEVSEGQPRRHRIEHAQLVSPEDLSRFAELGVIASMQPTHATTDMRWCQARIGTTRLAGAYAWKSLKDRGATLAFGSDAPVERLSPPLRGIYAAMTRQDDSGQPAGGWRPSEKLSFGEALQGFSAGDAFACFEDDRRGRIAVGYRADFTVLSADPTRCKDPKDLLEIRVLGTWIDGRPSAR